MDAWTIARRHATSRRHIAAAATAGAARTWRGIDPADLIGSWALAKPRILATVAAGQYAVAATATGYISDVLAAEGLPPAPALQVDPQAFAGVAADGRSMSSLLQLPMAAVYQRISGGATARQALNYGGGLLTLLADSEVADAGRGADSVAMAAEPRCAGYVRIITGGACGRCAILAGRWYRWNAAFARHPHCHCQQVPAADEAQMAKHLIDPHSYFESLSADQQNRAFTVAGARAIRDGANIGQVVNARRGIYTASIFGRDVQATTEGATRHSLYKKAARKSGRPVSPVRLTPQAIYELASDREEAIRLLYRFGYLL